MCRLAACPWAEANHQSQLTPMLASVGHCAQSSAASWSAVSSSSRRPLSLPLTCWPVSNLRRPRRATAACGGCATGYVVRPARQPVRTVDLTLQQSVRYGVLREQIGRPQALRDLGLRPTYVNRGLGNCHEIQKTDLVTAHLVIYSWCSKSLSGLGILAGSSCRRSPQRADQREPYRHLSAVGWHSLGVALVMSWPTPTWPCLTLAAAPAQAEKGKGHGGFHPAAVGESNISSWRVGWGGTGQPRPR